MGIWPVQWLWRHLAGVKAKSTPSWKATARNGLDYSHHKPLRYQSQLAMCESRLIMELTWRWVGETRVIKNIVGVEPHLYST
jgi:hypothetical protein